MATDTTTKCEVTPTAVIMQQIQVSTKQSIVFRKKKSYAGNKAKKNLNSFYLEEHLMNLEKDKLIKPKKKFIAGTQIDIKDKNNNIIIAPKYMPLNENCKDFQSIENFSPLALKHLQQSIATHDASTSKSNKYFQNSISFNESTTSTETTTLQNNQTLCIKELEIDEYNTKHLRDRKDCKSSKPTYSKLLKYGK